MSNIKGSMTALITPFKNGAIDEDTYIKLIKRQIENGIEVIVPVGTTGESATLSHEEHKRCIEIAVSVAKNTKTKVLAGAGSNSTKEAVDLAKFAQNAGADAILAVTPYYNKPTQNGLYEHYKAIANSIDIDIVLYNVPSRTGVDLDPKTVKRLFDDFKNIVAIKEASGSIERVIHLATLRNELTIISGDDALNFAIMTNGGKGTISVTANIVPDMISELIKKAEENEIKKAQELNLDLFALNKVLFCESNPIPIKAAMHIAGLLPSLEYRLPLVAPTSENYKNIEKVISKYNIKGF
ncbi:MAG: 4-hydroxy-tetrahydrodipicolinate synthase [Campylobacterota bacterium]|nr:4-hydroxy-tetrahydrodipicolinate synthase [Campylobacterota bacterium]